MVNNIKKKIAKKLKKNYFIMFLMIFWCFGKETDELSHYHLKVSTNQSKKNIGVKTQKEIRFRVPLKAFIAVEICVWIINIAAIVFFGGEGRMWLSLPHPKSSKCKFYCFLKWGKHHLFINQWLHACPLTLS